MKWLLVPITVAWFCASAWYVMRQNTIGPHAADRPASTASIIHLGPSTNEVQEPSPTVAPIAAETPVQPVATTAEAFPLSDLTLRFVKNTQDLDLTAAELQWCSVAQDHLASDTGSRIIITGHTDCDGEAPLNERLSLQRALVVRDRLIELGLPADRIEAIGMGAAQPIADNFTSKGKALNRRVEVHVASGH